MNNSNFPNSNSNNNNNSSKSDSEAEGIDLIQWTLDQLMGSLTINDARRILVHSENWWPVLRFSSPFLILQKAPLDDLSLFDTHKTS